MTDNVAPKPEQLQVLHELQDKTGVKRTRLVYRNRARERSTLLNGSELGSSHPRTKHNAGKSVKELMESETQALSAGEAAFVQNVCAGMLPTTAARAAGYGNATAAAGRMQAKPSVVAAILREKRRTADKNDMTRKRVLDGFLEAIEAARVQSDPLAMISGWREIAKMCGFYEATKHKVEISVSGQVMHSQLQTMSDDELLKLAERGDVIDAQVVEVKKD